jgi:hypothetical protein
MKKLSPAIILGILITVFVSSNLYAKGQPVPSMEFDTSTTTGKLLNQFHSAKTQKELIPLKKKVLNLGGKSVKALIRVMKDSRFPEKSQWTSTFLLAKIAGKKASKFLLKFLKHPSWMMRTASLKALLGLGEKRFGDQYVKLLKDKSLIVRVQALENIRELGLTEYAPQVWAMLYDKSNYHQVEGKNKRADIIKSVILAIGELRFKKARKPLLKMIQQKRYEDIFPEIEHALEKLTGKDAPENKKHVKRRFWKKVALQYTTL